MYRLEKEQYGKKQVKEIIETKEGSLRQLLSINDRPLTAKQQEEEDQRVRELMTNRGAQQKLRRALDAETLQGRRLFKMLPDAFVFNYAGGDENLVKLSSGGELDQIQFLLGHVWVQTTERYLGCKQNLGHPVNDRFTLGIGSAAPS
jgi:hypothetical protein